METLRLDRYVTDVLLRDLVGHDHSPAAFVVYLFLWSRSAGRKKARLSHQNIADETGLSKSAVQQALRLLHRRQLVTSERRHQTDTPEHTVHRPWRRSVTRAALE